MQFTLDPSGTPRQQAWVNNAIAKCTLPLDAINAVVTVVWSDSSPCGLAHPYMCTNTPGDGTFTIAIEPWADDPTNPNLRGLPNPPADIAEFYMESFVHELGHVVHYSSITDDALRAQIAGLFWTAEANSATGRRWGTLADYAPAETTTLRWAEAIVEAIAECLKCAFYSGNLIYMNRSAWRIDPQEWDAFIAMLLPAPGSFDETWAADANHQPLDAGDYASLLVDLSGAVVPEGLSTTEQAGYHPTSFVVA